MQTVRRTRRFAATTETGLVISAFVAFGSVSNAATEIP